MRLLEWAAGVDGWLVHEDEEAGVANKLGEWP